MRRVELTGREFGCLTVVALAPSRMVCGSKRVYWNCKCKCGSEVDVMSIALLSGNSASCGCKRLEAITSHQMADSDEYRTWASMIQRCANPKSSRYSDYGGRGISICAEWMQFEAFYADMGRRPTANHSIDRIDNESGYSKANCRWATRSEQQRNKRAPNTENLVRGDDHWTRKQPERARAIGMENITKAHGRLEKNSNAKLTGEIAGQMRDVYAANTEITLTALGSQFGVGRETARKVIRGLLW